MGGVFVIWVMLCNICVLVCNGFLSVCGVVFGMFGLDC